MTLETTVNDLTLAVTTLTTSVQDKRTVLDAAAQAAAASLTTTQGLQTQAAASAATAAAKATEATNNATQIAAYKTAAAALDTSTTATAAVTNLLPDMLAKKDPARHPFRKKMPTLVLDFERQKCHRYSPSTGFGETPLLPFMTFARNSAATYTGPDGLIKTAAANEARYDYDPLTGECKGLLVEEQRTNLLVYSTHVGLAGSGWVHNNTSTQYKPSSYVGVTGSLTATDIIDSGTGDNFAFKSFSSVSGTSTYTATAYFRKTTGNAVRPALFVALLGGTIAATNFIVNTNTGIGVGTGVVEDCGAYWKVSCSVTDNNSGNNTAYFRVYPAYNLATDGASATRNDAATGTVTVCCPQMELGTFKTSYIPTPAVFSARASTATYLDANGVVQTAASGVARSNAYDYDSDGVLRPVGLLLEASATNQLLYSEQFDNAAWAKSCYGVTSAPSVTANYAASPDGTTTADRVVLALNGGTTIDDHTLLAQGQTTVASTTYTQSIWLKTTDGSTKTVQLSFAGENSKLITVTGTWQRFSNTGTASDTARGFRLALRGTSGTSDSADLLVWGAQQGVGSYPTSYIPTTSAQVTRAADTSTSAQATRVADDAKVDGTKFSDFYNQSQGTLVAAAIVNNVPNVYPRVCAISKADALADGVSVFYSGPGAKWGGSYMTNNVSEADLSVPSTFTAGVKQRIGLRLAKNDAVVAVGGGVTAADSSVSLPVATLLRVGAVSPSSQVLNGHVSRISYYPQPFTNEELQAATSA